MALSRINAMPSAVKQYLIVTGNYWAFTLTDGALRMLVILHFHSLGYSPLAIAMLFIFYEFFGVVTNLLGGWLGARIGLNRTMNIGLALQVVALSMLLVPAEWLTVAWVMAAQALSGIAKDLNKMSAKSAIKHLVPDDAESKLFKWVAVLTGSKNALKGMGFFLGAALLSLLEFQGAAAAMAAALAFVWLMSVWFLKNDLGKAKNKPKFRDIFSKSAAINYLSAARMFLFGARDVWFVIALPVFMSAELNWSHWEVGSFLAVWIIFYGLVQSSAPKLLGTSAAAETQNIAASSTLSRQQKIPNGRTAFVWALALSVSPLLLILGMQLPLQQMVSLEVVLVICLMTFGGLFAINSSLHSFLIVSFARNDGVSLDVGFYYMANAMGRLLGTLLSGYLYQSFHLEACLLVSSLFIFLAAALSLFIPEKSAS